MAKILAAIFSQDRIFLGNVEEEELDNTTSGVLLYDALELKDMLMPNQQGQVQRMVQFTQVLPFDKTVHNLLIKTVDMAIKLDPTTDSAMHYDQYVMHLRAENSNIEIAPAGANFGGKYGPLK